MPPDSLRSAVYRSFVTCGDPKGVVECKTIRKSKIDHPKMEENVVKQRTCYHLNVSDKEEGREAVCKGTAYDQLYSSSSFQLMEVSREAQKLNQVIDSWSKGMSFERHSKDIAKDLLKGALDLQESLVMLGKLQEASQHMAKLKKKQKDTPVKHGIAIERTTSERISDQRFNRLEFQKPRFSVDGASRHCFDELREVIRDSFARKNLLPPSCASEKSQFETRKVESPDLPFTRFTTSSDSSFEKTCFGRRKMITSSDVPSTSSSQSSIVQSQKVTSFDYSPTQVQQEKPDGPNLIARLMGLEEIPRKPQNQTSQKHLKNNRVVKLSRPIFEIDLPKAKKPTFISQKVDPKRRTLDEIIETMHLKGLLRSKSMDKSNCGTHQSSLSSLLNNFVDSPPIVIMKPRYALDSQGERFPPCYHEENPSGTRNRGRKWDSKEESSPENSDDQKGALNFTIYKKLRTEKDQNNKFSKAKGCKDHGEAPAKSKNLQVLVQGKLSKTKIITSSPGKYCGEALAKSRTFDVLSQEKQCKTKIIVSSPGKGRGEAPANSKPLEVLFQEKHPNAKFRTSSPGKYSGEAPANSKTVEVLIQEKQPNTMTRASSPGNTRQPKKEAIGKREDGTQQVAPAIRNSKEKKNAKIKDSAKFQDQSKMSAVKVGKPERKPLVAQEKPTIYDPKRIITTSYHNSIKRKKNVEVDKSVKSTPIAKVDNMERKDENVEMVQAVDEDKDTATTEVTSSEELQLEEVADIFENLVTDNTVNGENFACESRVPSIHCVAAIKLVEQINCNINLDFTENENFNSRSTTRYLLLSSESFLCQSEELFETDVWEPTIWKTTNVDHDIADSTLLLHCAYELLEHKRSQCALAVDPLSLKAIKMRKFSVSFD